VLVVGGSGGVGKTTTAAALALRAALDGRRVLVCTIDPSRRLATSLGLAQLQAKPRRIPLERLERRAPGELWAMMLDVKSTFDALVERYAGSPEARDRILKNRFYQKLSEALVGSHEYMAMEQLLDLVDDPRFELVVLDTPPTRHALDFLEAPERLLSFLDASVLRWLLKPYFVAGRLTLKVATKTGAFALQLADRFLGLQFLQDVSEFFLAFESMYDGFKERAARVFALLRDPGAGFVIVASPSGPTLDEALYFYRRLAEKEMPFVAFVVNRVHLDPATFAPGAGPLPELAPALADSLRAAFQDQQRLARAEQHAVARLEVDTREPLIRVPEFESDVHDLGGLREIGDELFAGSRAGDARRRPRRAPRFRGADAAREGV
jgi:anion-transporting  ArsA/GET3 family ATPase